MEQKMLSFSFAKGETQIITTVIESSFDGTLILLCFLLIEESNFQCDSLEADRKQLHTLFSF
jgi:hypothetical protein